MSVRITVLVIALALATWKGGWAGFAAVFFFFAILGWLRNDPARIRAFPQATGSPVAPSEAEPDPQDVRAVRGRKIAHRDPTRP